MPPLAAAAALAVGLGVLKRVVEAHHRTAPEEHQGSALVPALTSAPEAQPGAPALNGHSHPPKRTRTRKRTSSAPASGHDAESEFMTDLAADVLPSLRQIRARMHVGQDRAKTIREHLKGVLIRT